MKIERLQRILQLITVLQSGRHFKPDELGQLLNVTRRTIFRDLKTLQDAGIPCYFSEEHDGYTMEESFFLPPLNLELPEALALLMVTEHLGHNQGLPLQKKAHQAALKIQSSMPAHLREHFGKALKTTSVKLAPLADHKEKDQFFALIRQAILQQCKLAMDYDSIHDEGVVGFVLEPYHLHFGRRAWYVIGRSDRHEDIRTFKLSRIKRLETLPQRFVLEEPFNIDKYLGFAWSLMPEGRMYHIKLLFKPMVARNVAEVWWHKTQTLTWNSDGSLLYEVEVDGLTEISWWVAGYGDQVEVLAPTVLRNRMTQMARNMAAIYKDDAGAAEKGADTAADLDRARS